MLKHLLGNLFGGKAGHHGNYSSGHHGGGHGRHGYPSYPPSGSAPTGAEQQCASCGALNAADARFCQQCGTPLAVAPCPACGASIQPGAKFCANCGRPRAGGENTRP
jgi:ribosomal protein L40E